MKFGFIPFFIFFFVANFYYSQCMFHPDDVQRSVWYQACTIIGDEDSCDLQNEIESFTYYAFFILSLHQSCIEGYQCYNEGFKSYFTPANNQVDFSVHTLNLICLILIQSEYSMLKIRILSSMAMILMWTQLFFWFRLFDSLAQYVDLIFRTVRDIGNFMKVLVSLSLMFMSGFYMLQLNRMETGSDYAAQIFDENDSQHGSLYGGGIISQYFLLLGHFNKEGLWRVNDGYADSSWI